MSLILPDVVMFNAELESVLDRVGRARTRAAWLKHFDQELQKIDERLSLVKVMDGIVGGPGQRAGFWHVRRRNDPPAVDSYLPIEGPDGQFIEPHMGVLENLRKMDLQRPGALDEERKRREREERNRQRSSQLAHEDRAAEFATRLKAIESPGVLFGDNKWSWRAGKRKG